MRAMAVVVRPAKGANDASARAIWGTPRFRARSLLPTACTSSYGIGDAIAR